MEWLKLKKKNHLLKGKPKPSYFEVYKNKALLALAPLRKFFNSKLKALVLSLDPPSCHSARWQVFFFPF